MGRAGAGGRLHPTRKPGLNGGIATRVAAGRAGIFAARVFVRHKHEAGLTASNRRMPRRGKSAMNLEVCNHGWWKYACNASGLWAALLLVARHPSGNAEIGLIMRHFEIPDISHRMPNRPAASAAF